MFIATIFFWVLHHFKAGITTVGNPLPQRLYFFNIIINDSVRDRARGSILPNVDVNLKKSSIKFKTIPQEAQSTKYDQYRSNEQTEQHNTNDFINYKNYLVQLTW